MTSLDRAKTATLIARLVRTLPLRALIVSALLFGGCARAPEAHVTQPSAALTGAPNHPALAQGWLRTELYFALGLLDDPDPAQGISEQAWRSFLDTEVTPRFPAGLSVIDIYGQWQAKGRATPKRLRSKLLLILHDSTSDTRAAIDAIRVAWKRHTGQQSVLRVTQPAEVSF